MVCNVCGKQGEASSKFCEGCGSDLTTQVQALKVSEEERVLDTNRLIPAFILSILSIMLAFSFDYYNKWYITLIYLSISITGFILGMIAITRALKSKRPLSAFATTIIVLSSIGIACCGISMMVDIGRFIHLLAAV